MIPTTFRIFMQCRMMKTEIRVKYDVSAFSAEVALAEAGRKLERVYPHAVIVEAKAQLLKGATRTIDV